MKNAPLALLAVFLGTVFAAALYLRIDQTKRRLESQLAETTRRAADLDARLATAGEQVAALNSRLTTSAAELGDARGRLTATESRLTAEAARTAEVSRALDEAKLLLAQREARARSLAAENASLRQDLADTRAAAVAPEAVAAYRHTITELERQLASVQNGAAIPAAGASTAVFSSRRARPASVMSVGPQSAFVVLSTGATRGAQVGQEFTLSRGTEILASALISDVRQNFSVAQVRPNSLRGALQKGDLAVLSR